MKSGATIILLFFSAICFGQVKDTLYFLNETILIGELKKVKLGRIEFDADGIGDVSIKNDKLKTLSAKTHSYRVETTDKKVVYGFIEQSGNPGNIIICSQNEKAELKISSISSLSFYGQKFSTRLSGDVGAGYSYTKSSGIGRLNINETVTYKSRKVESQLDGSMILTTDSSKSSRERETLQFTTNYLFANSWYGGGIFSYQRNIELGLMSRWQEGIALGYKFLQQQRSNGRAVTGIVLNEEKNFSNNRNTTLEWVLQGNYIFFSFSKPNITLSTTQTAYFSLSQKGRIRNDGNIKLNWELLKDFSLNLSFYHNYDRKSPAANEPLTDYGFVAGLSYEF